MRRSLVALLLLFVLGGCGQPATPIAAPGGAPAAAPLGAPITGGIDSSHRSGPTQAYGSTIDHVVVIVQENRSTDNLFNGLPGANTVKYGYNSHGQYIQLQSDPLTGPYDMLHTHSDYQTDYARGNMNGFNLAKSKCVEAYWKCPQAGMRAYSYVPESDVQAYFDMAEQYAFADEMFETNQGPSFPAHQYLVSGTSTVSDGSSLRASENPKTPGGQGTGGCDSPRGTLGQLINSYGREDQYAFPCFDRTAITDLIDKRGLSWHYYQENKGPGLWNGLDAIKHLWQNRTEYNENVITPSSRVLTDISDGYLANVTWITPSGKASDHAGETNGSGPSWVASIVDEIGTSSFWNSTVIIVTWDDWGGWYDHVAPKQYNSYELGMRVPMIVISPYAKRGYVSHVPYEFGSILKYIETTFTLGSMGTTDVRANNISDMFDLRSRPRVFKPIKAKYGAKYFLAQPPTGKPPDDD
ncbi:MAG: alkaline phosphatase family protein [Candidatus Cybelea sp.]